MLGARSDAEGERALQPPPPPAAAKPVPEAAPATPANATGNNVVATPQSINDGAFSPDYAPPSPRLRRPAPRPARTRRSSADGSGPPGRAVGASSPRTQEPHMTDPIAPRFVDIQDEASDQSVLLEATAEGVGRAVAQPARAEECVRCPDDPGPDRSLRDPGRVPRVSASCSSAGPEARVLRRRRPRLDAPGGGLHRGRESARTPSISRRC
jgi:hypothetical protein